MALFRPGQSDPAAFPSPGAAPTYALLPDTLSLISTIGRDWVVRRYSFALFPLVLLELRPGDVDVPGAGCAYWYLSETGGFLGNTPDCIDAVLAARIRHRVLNILSTRQDEPLMFEALCFELNQINRSVALSTLAQLFGDGQHGVTELLDIGVEQSDRIAISNTAGEIALVFDNRLEWPVLNGGQIARLEHGWSADRVVTAFAPLLVLELRHENGAEASWVLDADGRRIDDGALRDPRTIEALRRSAPALLRRAWRQIFAPREGANTIKTLPVLQLNAGTAQAVLAQVRDLVMPDTVDLCLAENDPPIILGPSADYPDGLALPALHVRRAVSHSLYQAGVDAIRHGGQMRWPSPVDGTDSELEAVFVPQEYNIAYQFRDRNGLRFVVASGERDCVPIGLYLPNEHRFLCDAVPASQWFRGHIGCDFWLLLFQHVLADPRARAGRRRHGGGEIVNVFMTLPLLHIGHYVWNDLTGQAALLHDLGVEAPRSIVIASPEGQAEFFGAIDTLFPSLRGKVDRSPLSKQDFIDAVYQSDMVPIRFTGRYIDAALRQRIRDRIEATDIAASVRRQHAALGAGLVLIAGLRLEDRTLVDSAGFLEQLIEHLHRTRPGTVIVLDGRNTRPGGADNEIIASIKDHRSLHAPLQAELALVARVQAYAAGRQVSVVSTVGQSIEASMAWCYLATACISPWGAGLAKYRWLANLPSLVLTSRFNLQHRHDLDIYHSPRWMEAPETMLLPDPDRVVDRPDISGNAPSADDAQGRECFEIEPGYAWSLLDALLAPLARHPQTTGNADEAYSSAYGFLVPRSSSRIGVPGMSNFSRRPFTR